MRLPGAILTMALLGGQADDPSLAKSRTLDCRDGDTVAIRVRVSNPNQNVLTAVTFPDLVQNVVSSWNDRDLSVEYQGAKLFLKLLAKAEGHLDVVTAAGTHVRLYITPTGAGQEYDGHVVLKTAAAKSAEEAASKLPDALELVRAMRLGLVPAGASIRRGGDALVSVTGDVEGRLALVYETTAYRGYVIRIVNKSPKHAYQLDVTRFSSSRLVLIGAKSLLIPSGKSTLIYLVLWK
ncbi:MAG: hypothetical protein HYY17_13195 [Planctomycetes bacterium]|nr:hypothetical protein [Planctomycetota bacterium]